MIPVMNTYIFVNSWNVSGNTKKLWNFKGQKGIRENFSFPFETMFLIIVNCQYSYCEQKPLYFWQAARVQDNEPEEEFFGFPLSPSPNQFLFLEAKQVVQESEVSTMKDLLASASLHSNLIFDQKVR